MIKKISNLVTLVGLCGALVYCAAGESDGKTSGNSSASSGGGNSSSNGGAGGAGEMTGASNSSSSSSGAMSSSGSMASSSSSGGMGGSGGAASSSSSGGMGGSGGAASSSSTGGMGGSGGIGGMGGMPNVVINEVQASGGMPGDWVELYNAGTAMADLNGWILKDNDDTHMYVLPNGALLAPGAYLVLDEAVFGYGFGAIDSARLFDASGTKLVDSYSWTEHAVTTYGRCPNGTGAFKVTVVATKGAANDCVP